MALLGVVLVRVIGLAAGFVLMRVRMRDVAVTVLVVVLGVLVLGFGVRMRVGLVAVAVLAHRDSPDSGADA
ncbi:MAG: hypothetical protein WKF41_05225 [Gaiellaceae bacterium]